MYMHEYISICGQYVFEYILICGQSQGVVCAGGDIIRGALALCVCMYIYMYVYIYVCYLYIHTHIYICMYVCTDKGICFKLQIICTYVL